MRRQLEWHHLRLTAGSHAGSVALSDAEDGRPLGTLTVDFPTPWVPGPATLDDDEFEWQWTRDDQPADDATAPAHLSSTRPSSTDLSSSHQPSSRQPGSTRATVRISTQPGFSLRVALATHAETVAVEPPTLLWTPPGPARRWVGGSSALLVLDDRPGDGLVTAAHLSHGQAWPDEAGTTPPPSRTRTPGGSATHRIALGPPLLTLTPERGYSTTWVIERFASLMNATSTLPGWLPPDCTPRAGEPLFIDLPDAAVTGDVEIVTDEHGTQLSADGGTHDIGIHGPGIDSSFTITWNAGTDRVLRDVAAAILGQVDPRTARGSDAALIDRADTAHLIPHDDAERFLDDFFQELSDAPPGNSIAPEATAALLHWAFADATRMAAALQRLDGLAPGPGPMLAWLSASLAARAAMLDFDATVPMDPHDPLCGALHAILTRADSPTPAVWQTIGLLHGPLPGPLPDGDSVRTAQACAILALAPTNWQVEQRLGASLAHEIEDTRAWLAASSPDGPTLSWLLWA